MILDAILLASRKIASTQQRDVAILPEMKIAEGDGVQISHPVSGYELSLSGNVDYAVIEYENVMDNKGEYQTPSLHELPHGLLRPVDPEAAFDIANGRLFLVGTKRQSLEQSLISHIPEAVSQAIALLKSAKYVSTVCFTSSSEHCLLAFQRSVFLSI